MEFFKYQGLGNDFVLLDRRGSGLPDDPADWALRLCNRRLGVGADGVLFLLDPTSSAARAGMRMFNADGSEAEMCGNGLRCLARHLYDTQGPPEAFTVDTGAGTLQCRIGANTDGGVKDVTVSMGGPRIERPEIPMRGEGRCLRSPITVNGQQFEITALSMGNPHSVAFLEGAAPEDAQKTALKFGPALEVHPVFPNRVNASFVVPLGEDRFEAAVWERGCGLTQACGTGATAIAVAACLEERAAAGRELEIRLPGGSLYLTVAGDYSDVTMRGPAQLAFQGSVPGFVTPPIP
jgi:diaminopimelate epimerase